MFFKLVPLILGYDCGKGAKVAKISKNTKL